MKTEKIVSFIAPNTIRQTIGFLPAVGDNKNTNELRRKKPINDNRKTTEKLMQKKYKHIGTCIFCLRSEPEVSFLNKPHTMPQTMGGRNIGFDICDECNHYFGTADRSLYPAFTIETCVKEILNVTKYLVDMAQAQKEEVELPYLKSIYFAIYQKEWLIKFKKSFDSSQRFHRLFTRCFKRGLYEMFLQEYHRQTKRGMEPQFDMVRRFARYNEGEIPIWHMQLNKVGIHFVTDESKGIDIPINEKSQNDIDEYGMITLWLRGFIFFLAVTPKAREKHLLFLKRENDSFPHSFFRGVEVLEDVSQIDFTLSRFNREE